MSESEVKNKPSSPNGPEAGTDPQAGSAQPPAAKAVSADEAPESSDLSAQKQTAESAQSESGTEKVGDAPTEAAAEAAEVAEATDATDATGTSEAASPASEASADATDAADATESVQGQVPESAKADDKAPSTELQAASTGTDRKKTPPRGKTYSQIIESIEKPQMRKLADFAVGDTVSVQVRVIEGERKRVQSFNGVVIAKRNRGLNSSFRVRKKSRDESVERVFQSHSPLIASVKVKTRGRVRRAKLYYLRKLSGLAARIEEKIK